MAWRKLKRRAASAAPKWSDSELAAMELILWERKLRGARRYAKDDLFTVAILEAGRVRWRGMRSRKTLETQAMAAAALLRVRGRRSPLDVTIHDLYWLCDACLDCGLSPGTVSTRLSCLSVIGVTMPPDFHHLSVLARS
jgi:hypothetical protein